MVKIATFATRFISFGDDPQAPAEVKLSEDQEIVAEDPPAIAGSGSMQRFMYVRGPLHQPIYVIRRERLPDGSALDVRYEPELDVICANTFRG
ncbi:MAG: hypothetical protein HY291_22950 [Planctomycetes bacterium]|nr:hypothetical protein [Planctomycetota bacterium]